MLPQLSNSNLSDLEKLPLERFNQIHLLAVHQYPLWEASCRNREQKLYHNFWENCLQVTNGLNLEVFDKSIHVCTFKSPFMWHALLSIPEAIATTCMWTFHQMSTMCIVIVSVNANIVTVSDWLVHHQLMLTSWQCQNWLVHHQLMLTSWQCQTD